MMFFLAFACEANDQMNEKTILEQKVEAFKFLSDCRRSKLAEDPELTIRPYFFPNNFETTFSNFLTFGFKSLRTCNPTLPIPIIPIFNLHLYKNLL